MRVVNVLHLAAGNRWTGAAAPAFAEVEALRAAGVEAHYAYVGGYKLEQKLAGCEFAHPILDRNQNPASFRRSVAAVRKLAVSLGVDVLHAHLTHDHWLAHFAAKRRAAVARTFHAARVLRADPLTRHLVSRTAGLFAINDSFPGARLFEGRSVTFTPPPIDHRQFHPGGDDARALHAIPRDVPVVAAIGKLSQGRGFEAVLETFAELRRRIEAVRLMIIGHGEHRPALESHARALGVAGAVIWAGYHEDDLAEHYRAADLLLFTAKGSDEGHRAVLEAMACGAPAVAYPLDGMTALAGSLADRLIAHVSTPAALAATAAAALEGDRDALRAAVVERSRAFGYEAAAQRLVEAYARFPAAS